MSRQPKQVHIWLYRKNKDRYEYAVFQRSENPLWWQGVCGGLEDNETLEEGARREIYEEAGVSDYLPLYRLDNISYLPAYIFGEQIQNMWGKDTVVIPMFFFAMPFDGKIKLSDEHTNVRWLEYEEAVKIVYFNDQRTSLWELNERLLRGNLMH